MNKRVYEVKGQLQVSVPKTKASIRRLVLPPGVVEVLRQYQKTVVHSCFDTGLYCGEAQIVDYFVTGTSQEVA